MTPAKLEVALARVTPAEVARALDQEELTERELVALLSPTAAVEVEALAARAGALTRRRFGRTMQLYAPLYLSNECVNRCAYCGFAHHLAIDRVTLTLAMVTAEAERLRAEGFRHLLLVAGEAPSVITVAYLEQVARALRPRFASLAIEVGTFDREGYQRLAAAGIDGFTLYQETYLEDVYARVHLSGPKRSYARRFLAMEHAGEAGFRSLGVGALLGLAPWRLEAFYLARHARALARKFWKSRVAVSFPRIQQHAGGTLAIHPVSDLELAQMIAVMRLYLPDAELVLSTREPEELRDRFSRIGVTRMSAGSRTSPGGYGELTPAGEQFQIADERGAHEVAAALVRLGFEPVWKDFDERFVTGDRA